jgi:hypothetical protein
MRIGLRTIFLIIFLTVMMSPPMVLLTRVLKTSQRLPKHSTKQEKLDGTAVHVKVITSKTS